jgi:hypothetical protein
MPFLVAGLMLVAWFVWANWGRDKAGAELNSRLDPVWSRFFRRKKCRWQEIGPSGESLRAFRCDHCGVTAYSSIPSGPRECKRGLTGGL